MGIALGTLRRSCTFGHICYKCNNRRMRIKVQAVPSIPSRTIIFAEGLEGAESPATIPPRSALPGGPGRDVKPMPGDVGWRPPRQRMALGWILFGKGDRHVTAEMLYEEATKAKVPVSLATVYNTLHQFTDVGLLRQVAVGSSKTYLHTNVTPHHHVLLT